MNNLSKFIFYINIDQKVELLFDKIARRASTRMYEELIDVLLVMKQELVIDSHGIALTTNIDFKITKSLKYNSGLFLHGFFTLMYIIKNSVLHALKRIYMLQHFVETFCCLTTNSHVIPTVLFTPMQFLTILIYDLIICR